MTLVTLEGFSYPWNVGTIVVIVRGRRFELNNEDAIAFLNRNPQIKG